MNGFRTSSWRTVRIFLMSPFTQTRHGFTSLDTWTARTLFLWNNENPFELKEISLCSQNLEYRVPKRWKDSVPVFFYKNAINAERYHTWISSNPHMLEEMKKSITEHIKEIQPDILWNMFKNMQRCVQTCLSANGAQFQHLL